MAKLLSTVLAVTLSMPFAVQADDVPSLESRVLHVFGELQRIEPMTRGCEYTVTVDGREETGPKESFLRRRTAVEIWTSGLASGCGDYATAFIERIEAQGIEALLVDGAEVSEKSLESHFSGHGVVAVRERMDGAPWWLVDPTARQIISRDWKLASMTFRAGDRVYWIAFCGRRQDYPVRNADQIREFYGKALDSIPSPTLSDLLKRNKEAAEPSATDNPDDAQRSREDH